MPESAAIPTRIRTPILDRPLRVALIGYGNAARIFHAPLIHGTPALQLAVVCSSKPAAVQADWPGTAVAVTAQQAFDDPQVDLVVIATSNESHYGLARAALAAGKHVVVDKPCTVTLAQTHDLLQCAQHQGRVLTVFQNRRWDADFLSLQAVLATGVLGRIVLFESHFDRYRPVVPARWREQDLPGSGLWFDLGSHLVDQCLQLFGMPDDLMLDLACQRDGAQVNDYFHATLRYGSRYPGLRALLHGSTLVPDLGPRFVVHGTKGSLVKYGLDVQEDALKAGLRPDPCAANGSTTWGHDPASGRITLPTAQGAEVSVAPQIAGNYFAFYAQLAAHVQGREARPAVCPADVEQAMRLLTLGETSAAQGRFVVV